MQRKRHINFKDKELNSSSSGRLSSILHSIPILLNMKNKSNVLYSIPCGCVLALLLMGLFSLSITDNSHAIACPSDLPDDFSCDALQDEGAITAITGGSTTLPTVSLALSKANLVSDTVAPGQVTIASTDVTINISNASSYSLTLSFDDINLTNGSTTIAPGNAINDNTWGYAWDGATTYTAPSTSGNTLVSTTNLLGDVNVTKTLAFAARFANSADAGHYKTNGLLSLTASPKETVITMADLTEMQQLAEGYAPSACKNTAIPNGQNYAGPFYLKDVRDNETYTIYKFKDDQCWMAQNLRIGTTKSGITYFNGRFFNSATSDITSDSYRILGSYLSNSFKSDTESNAYYSPSTNTTYYTWCAATAGTCSSATSDGANALSSICPKGWKLPAGYQSTKTNNDFWNLFHNMGLTISNDNLASNSGDSTNWGTGDLAITQGSPYNFTYTGSAINGSFKTPASQPSGSWWSRTAKGGANAYYLYIDGSRVGPGTGYNNRYYGYAVRCVAQ